MRSIGTHQFQQNFHKEIKKLPFAVTRYGKVLFYVSINNPEQSTPQKKSLPKMQLFEVEQKSEKSKKLISKWPSHVNGKPLSGRSANCPNCHESVPIEFASKHYMDEHNDI